MPEPYIITGTITSASPFDRIARVQTFDRDLPSLERRTGSAPQMLGEATTDGEGRFQITYTLEQFQSGESMSTFRRIWEKSADLSFRVLDRTGQELTIKVIEALGREYRPEQIIFNVPSPIEVTIVLEGRQESAGTSEYELLIALLAPVVQDVPLMELSDEDIAFLSNELGLEQQHDVQQRIEWLRRSALLALQTSLPIEAFYGWGRKDLPALLSELEAVPLNNLPAILEKLTGLGVEKLREALWAAIAENIIPASFRSRADEIIRQLIRHGQEPLPVNARLLDEETGAPLAGYSVTTFDKDAGDENLGLDITDQGGGFFFTFSQPRGLSSSSPARQFSFKVVTPSGEALPEGAPTAINPVRVGAEVVFVKIRVPKPPAASLEKQLEEAKLLAPPTVLRWLNDKGILTFAEIRRKGGLSKLADCPPDLALIHKLDSLADLDRISASVQVSTVLFDKGYDSVLAIADTPYSEFISLAGDEDAGLNQMELAKLHVMATTQTNLLNNILMRMAVDSANGFAIPAQSENPAGGDK